jgi:hypothetical protein
MAGAAAVGRARPRPQMLASASTQVLTFRMGADDSVMVNGRVRLGGMGEALRSPLNLNALLAAVEAAPPVAAVDVLAAALAEAVGAREVSFLIADFSGRWFGWAIRAGRGFSACRGARLRSGCRWSGRRTEGRWPPSPSR